MGQLVGQEHQLGVYVSNLNRAPFGDAMKGAFAFYGECQSALLTLSKRRTSREVQPT
jgi:hypothetical protein